MPIRHEHRQLSESGFNANSPIGVARLANLNAWSAWIVKDDFPARKSAETPREIIRAIRRNINPILWDGLQCFVRGSSCMPIELRVYAARPLDDRVSPNRVVARSDQDIRTARARCANSRIQV